VAVLVVLVPFALAACSSSSGQSLAQQACVDVHRSVHDWDASEAGGVSASASANLQMKAEQQLRLALPLAAAANSDDGSWNSLMTTISEIGTVDEGHLVPALQAQCVVADSNQDVNPQSPGNTGGTGGGGGGGAPGGGGGGSGRGAPPTGNVNPKG
jgi:uncharacterized membrane protein YgcG